MSMKWEGVKHPFHPSQMLVLLELMVILHYAQYSYMPFIIWKKSVQIMWSKWFLLHILMSYDMFIIQT